MIQGEGWYMIRELLREGLSVSEIARQTGRDRKTIRKVRDAPGHPGPQERRKRGSKLDPYEPYLRQRATAGVLNAVKLLEEVRRRGYPGGITLIRDFLHPLRPAVPMVTERFETQPGQQAQVDWFSCGRIWQRDRQRSLSSFTMTLGYSRRQYVEFTVSQDMETFLRCHINAFGYFRGIPIEILYDNLKTAVDHRGPDGQVVWNRRFRDFADYYGFVPRACQPYRAQTKGKVENGIRYVKGNFLLGLDVAQMTLEELNGEALRWLRETADVRVHGTTHERPIDRWPAEAAALRPLDGQRDYDTSYVCHRLVSREGYISYRGSRYSVPPEHAGRPLLVKEGADSRLRVYSGHHQIIEHLLAEKPGSVITAPGHPEAVRTLARARGRNGVRPDGRRLPRSTLPGRPSWPEVQVRPLVAYDEALGLVTVGT
ncbi:MAG: transposase [Dehalococcoidia bacterium]|nr:transposase [Dehalococcoidia bacterium]